MLASIDTILRVRMCSAPFMGGGFGHFFKYAPIQIEYAIDRFTRETKRQVAAKIKMIIFLI